MILDGFFNTINCSLQYMLNNTDQKTTPLPLFEARMELQVSITICRLFDVFSIISATYIIFYTLD